MARYKSIVAYDGTGYQGFQRQLAGIPTIQAELETALRAIGWDGESLLAAGRTDAGVHARGQVIAYDLDWRHDVADLTAALNANLPAAVAVSASSEVRAEFHPRFDASCRAYRYRLYGTQQRDPLRERYAWRRWPGPSMEAMAEFAARLLGRHEFRAFGSPPIEGGQTVRTVHQALWLGDGDELVFEISADAFLQHMVRKLVAACVAIGEGKSDPQAVAGLIDSGDSRWQGAMAPAKGLTLERVDYEAENP